MEADYQHKRCYDMQRTIILHKFLLSCGIVSSLWYVAMNIFVPMQLGNYDVASQTVSELSAIGVPTRQLWVYMAALYSLLNILFGWGIWMAASGNRSLRIAGAMLILNGLISAVWPPMHQREAIAAGQATLTDTMHIVFTFVSVLLMLCIIIFAAAAFGKRFRFYSLATIVILLVFGILTGLSTSFLEKNLPTPMMGIWERISIGVYMIWISSLSITILKHNMNQYPKHLPESDNPFTSLKID